MGTLRRGAGSRSRILSLKPEIAMSVLPLEAPGLELREGDAFELLPGIEPGSVDCVLTDPPYGTTNCLWDCKIDFARLFELLWRALKPDGVIVMFSQMPLAAELACMQKKAFRYEWIWEKTMPVGFLNARRMPLRAHENILVFYRAQPKFNAAPIESQAGEPYKRKRGPHGSKIYARAQKETASASVDGRRFPRDVIRCPQDRRARLHPTQKPVSLLCDLLRQYTNPGDLALDPFAGSGSSLLACSNLGRRCIGMERDPAFIKMIRERCMLPESNR